LIGAILAGAGYLTYRGVSSLKQEMIAEQASDPHGYADVIGKAFKNEQNQRITNARLANFKANLNRHASKGKAVKSAVTTRSKSKTDL